MWICIHHLHIRVDARSSRLWKLARIGHQEHAFEQRILARSLSSLRILALSFRARIHALHAHSATAGDGVRGFYFFPSFRRRTQEKQKIVSNGLCLHRFFTPLLLFMSSFYTETHHLRNARKIMILRNATVRRRASARSESKHALRMQKPIQ
jgi:hypothetical protein